MIIIRHVEDIKYRLQKDGDLREGEIDRVYHVDDDDNLGYYQQACEFLLEILKENNDKIYDLEREIDNLESDLDSLQNKIDNHSCEDSSLSGAIERYLKIYDTTEPGTVYGDANRLEALKELRSCI